MSDHQSVSNAVFWLKSRSNNLPLGGVKVEERIIGYLLLLRGKATIASLLFLEIKFFNKSVSYTYLNVPARVCCMAKKVTSYTSMFA